MIPTLRKFSIEFDLYNIRLTSLQATSESLHSAIDPLSVGTHFILNSLLAKTKSPLLFTQEAFDYDAVIG